MRFEASHSQEVSDETWRRLRKYFLPVVFWILMIGVGGLTNIVAAYFDHEDAIFPFWQLSLIGLAMGCLASLHFIIVYAALAGLAGASYAIVPTEALWIVMGGLAFVAILVPKILRLPFQLGEDSPLGTVYYIAKGLQATVFPIPRWLYVEPNYLSALGAAMAVVAAVLIHTGVGSIYVAIFLVGNIYFDTADGVVARRMKAAGHARKEGDLVDKRCDLIGFVALLSATSSFLPPATVGVLVFALVYDLLKEPMPFPAQNSLGRLYIVFAFAYLDLRLLWIAALLVLGRPLPSMIANAYFYYRRKKRKEIPKYLERNPVSYPLYFGYWILAAPLTAIPIAILWNDITGIISLSGLIAVSLAPVAHWLSAAALMASHVYLGETGKFRTSLDPWWFYRAMLGTAVVACVWITAMYTIIEVLTVQYAWAAIAATILVGAVVLRETYAAMLVSLKARKTAVASVVPGLSNRPGGAIYVLPKKVGVSSFAGVDLLGRIVMTEDLPKKLPREALRAVLEHEMAHSGNRDGLLQLAAGAIVMILFALPLPWVVELRTGDPWLSLSSAIPLAWLWLFTAHRAGVLTRGWIQTLHERRADSSVSSRRALGIARDILGRDSQRKLGVLERLWRMGMGQPAVGARLLT